MAANDVELPEGFTTAPPIPGTVTLPPGFTNTPVDPNTGQPIPGPPGNPVRDFTYGLGRPLDVAATLLDRGVAAAAPEGSGVQQWAQGDIAEIGKRAQAYKDFYGGSPPASSPQRDLGEMVLPMAAAYAMPYSTAGFLPRLASNAAGGAISSVITGDPSASASDIGKEAVQGGLLGSAAPLPTGTAARIAYPRMARPPAPGNPGYDQIMMDLGVRPTPGQLMGGSGGWWNNAMNRVEQGLGSIPIAGDLIKAARSRSVNQLNVGLGNWVLDPIGGMVEAREPGREMVREVQRKASDAYNNAVPAAGGALDQTAINDLADLRARAATLAPGRGDQFNAMLDQYVTPHIDPTTGVMTGQGFKDAESDLGKAANSIFSGNSTSDERGLGDHLRETQTVLRDWLERVSPAQAPQIQAANATWARLKRFEAAAGRPNADPGTIQPLGFDAAVRAYMPKSRVAGGTALGQDISDASRAVLGPTVPDSGTPFRSMIPIAAGLVGAGVAGHEGVDPRYIAAGLAGTGATAAMYNPAMQRLMAHMMATRYPWQENIATGIRQASPLLAGAAPPGLLNRPQY
jgi:hypothetical protein